MQRIFNWIGKQGYPNRLPRYTKQNTNAAKQQNNIAVKKRKYFGVDKFESLFQKYCFKARK